MGYGWDDFMEDLGFKEPDRSGEVQTSTVTSKGTTIPEYLETFSKEQLDLIDRLSKSEYRDPSVSGIAGFTDDQRAALDAASDYYGAEGGTDAYKAASGALSDLSGLSGQRITDEGALTPFMNQYLDPMREEIDRAYEQAQIKADAGAMGPGGYSAFGNTRRGLVQSNLLGEGMRQKGLLQADAFNKAVSNYYKDMAARGTAAGATMTGAKDVQNIKGKDFGGQFLFGGYEQAMNQAELDEKLAREKAERDWGFKMADFRQGGLTNLPYGTTVTQTSDVFGGPGGNTFMSGLGGLGTVASGIGSFFATPAGTGQSPAQGWGNLWDSAKGWFD